MCFFRFLASALLQHDVVVLRPAFPARDGTRVTAERDTKLQIEVFSKHNSVRMSEDHRSSAGLQ